MHVGVTRQPAVVLGLVGIEIVVPDMEGGIGIGGDDPVHEVAELDAAPARLVSL